MPPEVISQLNYDKILQGSAKNIFSTIHKIPWEVKTPVSEYFELHKINADVTKPGWQLKELCNIIYFDAFGPDKQPDMWKEEIFRTLFEMTLPEGVFVTYSAKGEVRRRLTKVGYTVERLTGPPGKKEMLRGRKWRIN